MAQGLHVCAEPGCPVLTTGRFCVPHDRVSARNEDLAWAAGFFDGEGTITISSGSVGGHSGSFYVGVNQATTSLTDLRIPPVLERFQGAVGCGVIRGPYRQSAQRRPLFKWYVRSDAAEAVLELLWPFLTETKRDQAERVRQALRELRGVA